MECKYRDNNFNWVMNLDNKYLCIFNMGKNKLLPIGKLSNGCCCLFLVAC